MRQIWAWRWSATNVPAGIWPSARGILKAVSHDQSHANSSSSLEATTLKERSMVEDIVVVQAAFDRRQGRKVSEVERKAKVEVVSIRLLSEMHEMAAGKVERKQIIPL
jgi:hypothetical protein